MLDSLLGSYGALQASTRLALAAGVGGNNQPLGAKVEAALQCKCTTRLSTRQPEKEKVIAGNAWPWIEEAGRQGTVAQAGGQVWSSGPRSARIAPEPALQPTARYLWQPEPQRQPGHMHGTAPRA